MSTVTKAQLKKIFEVVDEDKSGTVSKKELKQYCQTRPEKAKIIFGIDVAGVEGYFEKADANDDNRICYDEWVQEIARRGDIKIVGEDEKETTSSKALQKIPAIKIQAPGGDSREDSREDLHTGSIEKEHKNEDKEHHEDRHKKKHHSKSHNLKHLKKSMTTGGEDELAGSPADGHDHEQEKKHKHRQTMIGGAQHSRKTNVGGGGEGSQKLRMLKKKGSKHLHDTEKDDGEKRHSMKRDVQHEGKSPLKTEIAELDEEEDFASPRMVSDDKPAAKSITNKGKRSSKVGGPLLVSKSDESPPLTTHLGESSGEENLRSERTEQTGATSPKTAPKVSAGATQASKIDELPGQGPLPPPSMTMATGSRATSQCASDLFTLKLNTMATRLRGAEQDEKTGSSAGNVQDLGSLAIASAAGQLVTQSEQIAGQLRRGPDNFKTRSRRSFSAHGSGRTVRIREPDMSQKYWQHDEVHHEDFDRMNRLWKLSADAENLLWVTRKRLENITNRTSSGGMDGQAGSSRLNNNAPCVPWYAIQKPATATHNGYSGYRNIEVASDAQSEGGCMSEGPDGGYMSSSSKIMNPNQEAAMRMMSLLGPGKPLVCC